MLVKLVGSFLHCFDDGVGYDCVCRLHQHEQIIAVIEEILHAPAWVAQLKLADEHTLNAFFAIVGWHRACIGRIHLFGGSIC